MQAIKWKIKSVVYGLIWVFVLPALRAKVNSLGANFSITCDRNDGGGAQLHGRLSVAAFAQRIGATYKHTPITSIYFGDSEDWLRRWNSVIDFNSSNTDSSEATVACSSLYDLVRRIFSLRRGYSKQTLSIIHAHGFTNSFPKSIKDVTRGVDFLLSPASEREDLARKLVVHVRRPLPDDVFADNSFDLRFSSPEYLIGAINKVIIRTGVSQVHIFTTPGGADYFRDFPADWVVDDESDAFEALAAMAHAQVFVMSKSSLSYVGACFNPNVVFYQRFWHPRLRKWRLVS